MGDKPYKDWEEVKNIINKCSNAGGFLAILGLVVALVGVIGDALDITIGLESTSWLLLAILFVVASFLPNLNSLMAKHMYGVESERKK